MTYRVLCLNANGWWRLQPCWQGCSLEPIVELPTFMLPKWMRYQDRVELERAGDPVCGFWRVVRIN